MCQNGIPPKKPRQTWSDIAEHVFFFRKHLVECLDNNHDKIPKLEERCECSRLQNKDTKVLIHTIMFNYFQSLEINESGNSFNDNCY